MANVDLLERLADGEDRDIAPFFAGRKTEIRKFERAVVRSKDVTTTQFRIFQGAPGCGKTSLLNHLMNNEVPENRLFVTIDEDEMLTSTKALAQCVDDAVSRSPSPAFARLGSMLGTAGTLGNLVVSGVKPLADAVGTLADATVQHHADRAKNRRLQDLELVLVCDEAQVLNAKHEGVLRMLHKTGLRDIPSVLLLAGLGHTKTAIRKLDGLSRLAATVDVNMGLLSEAECADSTRQMLSGCEIAGADTELNALAKTVAAMAKRWPQHLACAHAALARELLDVRGDIAEVDIGKVERETTESRHAYYEGRFEDHPALENLRFAAEIVASVHRQNTVAQRSKGSVEPVTRHGQVIGLCKAALEREPKEPEIHHHNLTPKAIAEALIERGILSGHAKEPYETTIPSMATWLGLHLPPSSPLRNYLRVETQLRRA